MRNPCKRIMRLMELLFLVSDGDDVLHELDRKTLSTVL